MSDEPLPSFYDLDAFAESLPKDGRYVGFVDQVRRYRDAMSALNDLRECTEFLDVLESDDRLNGVEGSADSRAVVIAGALLAQAVIWYVRATKTRSDHRTFVPISDKMPPGLLPLHRRMVGLRDGAIAHFGPAPEDGRPSWVTEVAALRVDGDQASLVFPYTRSKVQTDIAGQLRRLLEFAVPRAWALANERGDILLPELKRLYDTDEGFAATLRRHGLDLLSFFDGDPDAVRQTLDARHRQDQFVDASYWGRNFATDG